MTYAVAHYALEGLPNKVLAAEYRTALPDEKILEAEIERTRRKLEERAMLSVKRKDKNWRQRIPEPSKMNLP